MLAAASNGIVIGFNVRPDTNAQKAAEKEGVEIKLSRVIYELIDGVRKLMSGLLIPNIRRMFWDVWKCGQPSRFPKSEL